MVIVEIIGLPLNKHIEGTVLLCNWWKIVPAKMDIAYVCNFNLISLIWIYKFH